MSAVLRSEWIKFTTVRSTWVMVGFAIGGALVISGFAAGSHDGGRTAETLAGGAAVVLVLLLVLGIQFIAQEYRFGTIRPSFTSVPDRTRLLVAKTVLGAGVGLATAATAAAGSFVVASIVLNADGRSIPFDAHLAETVSGYVLTVALCVPFGIGVGAITRNPALGITAVLVDMFVLESLVAVFVSEDVGSVLPFSTAFASIPGAETPELLSPWFVGVLLYAAWTSAVCVLGAVIVNRRDP